jgi:hypothetical protein
VFPVREIEKDEDKSREEKPQEAKSSVQEFLCLDQLEFFLKKNRLPSEA